MPYVDETTFEVFKKKISRINKKLVKNGIKPITYDVSKKRVSYANLRGFADGSKQCPPEWHSLMYEVLDVNIYKDVVIPETGWTLVAIINHIDHVITKFDESMDVENFRNNSFCDHCKTKRVRNTTLIVKKGDELKSIGKNCANDFFGIDLSGWLNKLSWYNWNPTCFEFDYSDFIERFSGYQMFKCVEMVALAHALISKFGFISSDGLNATKDQMIYHINKNLISETVTGEDRIVAEKIISWGVSIDDNDNAFMLNIRSIFSSKYIRKNVFGFVAGGVKTYLEMTDAKEHESNFIGNIGDKKVKFENVTYKNCYKFMNEFAYGYGETYIHKFVDDNGNVIIWKTGKYINEENIGKKLNFIATIKNHEIYKNIKQTIVSYVKF